MKTKKSEMVIEVPDANAKVFNAKVTPSMLKDIDPTQPGVVDPTRPGGGTPVVAPGVVDPTQPGGQPGVVAPAPVLGPVMVDPVTNMPPSPIVAPAPAPPEFVQTSAKKAKAPASLSALLDWLKTNGVSDPEFTKGEDGKWLIKSPVDHVFHIAAVGNVLSASISGQDGVFFLELLAQE